MMRPYVNDTDTDSDSWVLRSLPMPWHWHTLHRRIDQERLATVRLLHKDDSRATT